MTMVTNAMRYNRETLRNFLVAVRSSYLGERHVEINTKKYILAFEIHFIGKLFNIEFGLSSRCAVEETVSKKGRGDSRWCGETEQHGQRSVLVSKRWICGSLDDMVMDEFDCDSEQ